MKKIVLISSLFFVKSFGVVTQIPLLECPSGLANVVNLRYLTTGGMWNTCQSSGQPVAYTSGTGYCIVGWQLAVKLGTDYLFTYDSYSCAVPTCPVNSTYNVNSESCVCDNGYPLVTDINGSKSCPTVSCPIIYNSPSGNSLPLFDQITADQNCSYSGTYVENFEISSRNVKCCYEGGKLLSDYNSTNTANKTCPVGQVLVDGVCSVISDSNTSTVPQNANPLSCPSGQIEKNGICVPDPTLPPNTTTTGGDTNTTTTTQTVDGNGSTTTTTTTTTYNNSLPIGSYTDNFLSGVTDAITNKVTPYLDNIKFTYTKSMTFSSSLQCTNPDLLGHTYDICSIFSRIFSVVRIFMNALALYYSFRLIYNKL